MSNERNTFAQTLSQAEADPDIHDLLVDIFGEQGGDEPQSDIANFSADAPGYGLLVWFAASILYRWGIDTLNSRRARLELNTTQQRIELILSLTDIGFPPEVAEALVTKSLEAIAKRDKDDPALNKILALISKAVNPAELLTDSGESKDLAQ